MQAINDEAATTRNKVTDMLQSVPAEADFAAKAIGQRLRPLDISTLDHFYTKASAYEHSLTFLNLEFDEWEIDFAPSYLVSTIESYVVHYTGTKQANTDDAQGIIRMLYPDGTFEERTVRAGEPHGLSRHLKSWRQVVVEYYEYGDRVAEFEYDNSLRAVIDDDGDQDVFDGLDPAFYQQQ